MKKINRLRLFGNRRFMGTKNGQYFSSNYHCCNFTHNNNSLQLISFSFHISFFESFPSMLNVLSPENVHCRRRRCSIHATKLNKRIHCVRYLPTYVHTHSSHDNCLYLLKQNTVTEGGRKEKERESGIVCLKND